MPLKPYRVHLSEALELLRRCSPETRLLHLKNLCVNNGVWTVPEDPARYRPVMFEVSLFGVPAVADKPEALPTNWMRAARNTLAAIEADTAT